MFKDLKNIFFLILITIFIFLSTRFYFSNTNKEIISKIRSNYTSNISENNDDIPILKNDTENFIEHSSELDEFKSNIIKRKFYELLK